MKVKIFGLKRSGTNYLEYILEQNGLKVLSDKESPWKHGAPINCADKHICIVKDPYTWRVSERCHSECDEETKQDINTWNNIVSQYLKAANSPEFYLITYKEILENKFAGLSNFLGQEINVPKIQNFMGYERDISPFKFDPEFYLKHKYFEYLTHNDIKELKKVKHTQFIETPLPQNHIPAISLTARATGHGDAIMASQLAYSLEKSIGRKVILYTNAHRTARCWLGYAARPVYKEEPDSIHINGWFTGPKSHLGGVTYGKKRIEFYRENLPPNMQDFPILIPPLAHTLPETPSYDICLFPYSTDPMRTYPERSWVQLYNLLKEKYNVVVALPKDVNYPVWNSCQTIKLNSIEEVISLIKNSKFTVGNDSGPIHIAGILDKKGLALLGIYSPETLFGGYSSVQGITNESTPCYHCFNLPEKGFSHSSCNRCYVLDSISPIEIFNKIKVCLS